MQRAASGFDGATASGNGDYLARLDYRLDGDNSFELMIATAFGLIAIVSGIGSIAFYERRQRESAQSSLTESTQLRRRRRHGRRRCRT
jgi:hypothetical protein